MKKITMLFTLVLVATAAQAGWNVAPCGAQGLAKKASMQKKIASAKKGDNLWLPKPYPKNASDVYADFRHQYLEMQGPADQVPAGERAFVTSVRDHHLSYEVFRVENWRANRCQTERDGDYMWLIRFTDARSGHELGRANLHESGLLESTSVIPSNWTAAQVQSYLAAAAILDPEDVVKKHAAKGLAGSEPQRIASWGALQCHEHEPCVAFKVKGDIYIQRQNELYRIAGNQRRISFQKELKDETRKRALEAKHDTRREKIMSLGGDQWIIAERVQ
jgi:hypothetical protein